MANPRLFRMEGIIGEDTISEDLDVFFDKLIASYDIEEYICYRQMDLKPCVMMNTSRGMSPMSNFYILLNDEHIKRNVNRHMLSPCPRVDPFAFTEADLCLRSPMANYTDKVTTNASLVDHASREVARTDHATAKEDSIPYQQDGFLKSPNKAPEQYNTVNELFEKNDNTNIACGFQDDNNSSNKRKKKKGSCNSDTKKRSRTVHDERQEDKQMLHDTFGFASLETAGTNRECRVRRSSRIKSRPLEFWRGERFLFGRIHESLTSVIGVKYGSPEKDKTKKRNLKVKSFVSDDYKELVDFAALH